MNKKNILKNLALLTVGALIIPAYAAAEIKMGIRKELLLGNIDAKRDWGYAKDYVEAMWMMLQQDNPQDYVIATGETHSIKDFLSAAFGFIQRNWEDYVVVDPKFYRPADVEFLLGNARKAEDVLGWKPEVSFSGLVEKMVIHDIEEAMEKTEENSSFTKTF